MGSRTRRDFLKLSAASALILTHGADAGDRIAQPAYRKPVSLDRYVDVLRILTGPYLWVCTDRSPTTPVSREPAGWEGLPTVHC